MKTLAPAAKSAIERGEAIVTGAVDITPLTGGTVIRLWGGHGPIIFGGNTYRGLGDKALAQQTSSAIGGVAQGLTLGLSAVEPAALALLNPAETKGATVVLYRLIFGPDGKSLLDAHVFDRGRGDALTSDETVGGTATIMFAVESAARGLGRVGARLRADYDQRLLNASDGYFKNTAYAAEKMLYWGGKKPANAGQAVAVSPPTGSFGS